MKKILHLFMEFIEQHFIFVRFSVNIHFGFQLKRHANRTKEKICQNLNY